jgi:hypothetical protein
MGNSGDLVYFLRYLGMQISTYPKQLGGLKFGAWLTGNPEGEACEGNQLVCPWVILDKLDVVVSFHRIPQRL